MTGAVYFYVLYNLHAKLHILCNTFLDDPHTKVSKCIPVDSESGRNRNARICLCWQCRHAPFSCSGEQNHDMDMLNEADMSHLGLTFLKGFLCLPITLCHHQLNWTSTSSSLPGAAKLVCGRFFVFKAPHLEKGHLVLMNTAHQMDLLTIFMVTIRHPAPMSGAATTTPISHDTVFFSGSAPFVSWPKRQL